MNSQVVDNAQLVMWLTEVVKKRITPASTLFVRITHWAVLEGFMAVTNLMEKVQFVLR